MLKIGLLTGEYPPMEGGVGAFTQELAKELSAQGHVVHIITSNQARPLESRKRPEDGDFVDTFNWIHNLREPIDIGFAQLHPRGRRWRWSDMATVADIALRYDLDVVNTQYQAAAYNMNSPAVNLLPWRLTGLTKSVVTFHDLRVPYLFPKAGSLRERAVRFLANQSDGVIVTNQADYDQLTDVTETPVRQIPIGSNIAVHKTNWVEIEEVREQFGLSADDKLLGYFGFVNESKGADTLIQALNLLGKKYHLVFIGGRTGASDNRNNQLFYDRLTQLIQAYQLDGRVHWTGFLSDQRVSACLNAADLITMPYKDGVSLRRGTLMAALAHGRPVISTHPSHSISQLTHGENIWLVPPDDPEALAEQIRRLIKDEPLRDKLGQGACEAADLFSWAQIARDTAAFFEEMVAQ